MNLSCLGEAISTIKTTEISIDQNLIKLNSLLAKFNRSHFYKNTLQLFNKILSSHNLRPDEYTLSSTLTACANTRDVVTGNQLHGYTIRAGFKAYPHVGNTLLSLYAKAEDLVSVKRVFFDTENPDVYSWTTLLSACVKFGQTDYALQMFDQVPQKNIAVWNAIITGCAENGNDEVAFDLFREMHHSGLRHDNYSFASVLSLCHSELIDFGRQVHSLVIKTGFLVRTSVANAQITMYFNCRNVRDAYRVFEDTELVHDHITLNAMIAGLASMEREEEAFIMFRKMQDTCLRTTELTFVSVMSSCSSTRVGQQVHCQAIKTGLGACTSVSNAAMTMYSNCGDLQAADIIFNRLEEKDHVSWNTMITSFAQNNLGDLAILAYLQMQMVGLKPDEFTIGSLLASSEFLEIVEMVQALICKNGLSMKIHVNNALISAYSKHGKIKQAYQVFQDMSLRNLISWNTVISGFLLNGFPLQGLEQFSEMLISAIRPNVYTLSLVLSICASIAALRHGKQIHNYILRFGFYTETALGNALITLYAKCGLLDYALRMFNKMAERDIISWNALISAYAQHGKGKEAVQCFETMQDSSGIQPDEATFTAVLSASSHAGLVDDGLHTFNSMVNYYGLMPGVDHFSCIVDLLSRAGYIDEAERLLNSEHFEAHSNIWWPLFSACATHGNLKLGRIVADILLKIEQNNPEIYVLLSNTYAAAGQWEEAANVRESIDRTGAVKQRACSSIRL